MYPSVDHPLTIIGEVFRGGATCIDNRCHAIPKGIMIRGESAWLQMSVYINQAGSNVIPADVDHLPSVSRRNMSSHRPDSALEDSDVECAVPAVCGVQDVPADQNEIENRLRRCDYRSGNQKQADLQGMTSYLPALVHSGNARPSASKTIRPFRIVKTHSSFFVPSSFLRHASLYAKTPDFRRNTAISAT